jgi:hypothetical protein
VLAALVVLPAAPVIAQDIATGGCKGARVYGDGEVPIQIQAKSIKAARSAKNVVDYGISVGPNNSMEVLCLHGGGSVVFTLSDSGRYAFRDIRFEYPYGFEPAASPFKLAVVQPDSVVLVIDPMVQNDPRDPP